MPEYNVILTYDVTISKVCKVNARNSHEAKEKAVDKAVRGELLDDYSLHADSPDDWSTEIA